MAFFGEKSFVSTNICFRDPEKARLWRILGNNLLHKPPLCRRIVAFEHHSSVRACFYCVAQYTSPVDNIKASAQYERRALRAPTEKAPGDYVLCEHRHAKQKRHPRRIDITNTIGLCVQSDIFIHADKTYTDTHTHNNNFTKITTCATNPQRQLYTATR